MLKSVRNSLLTLACIGFVSGHCYAENVYNSFTSKKQKMEIVLDRLGEFGISKLSNGVTLQAMKDEIQGFEMNCKEGDSPDCAKSLDGLVKNTLVGVQDYKASIKEQIEALRQKRKYLVTITKPLR